MTVDQGQSHQSRSGKERSSKPKYKEYEMSHRTELEHVLQRLVLMSYFPSGFWSRILTRILADDSVVEIAGVTLSLLIDQLLDLLQHARRGSSSLYVPVIFVGLTVDGLEAEI